MKTPNNQHGMALLVLVFFLTLAGLGYIVQSLSPAEFRNNRDKKTAAALAEAKMALIGWSVARGVLAGTDRPGELPCPDTDAPGAINYGIEEPSCVPGRVGRLPWKTLKIEELRDGDGEPLWYAIDGVFRKQASNIEPINSDTIATLQIYATDGITLITPPGNQASAVVFSAGLPIGGQSRSASIIATCPATGTNILQNRCSSNYLEIANGRNNAVNNGPFIVGDKTNTFNDRLTFITASELMTVVERRVAREAQALLVDYKNVNGYYPYPAKFDTTECTDVGNAGNFTDCISDATLCRGRFPDDASSSAPTPDWTLTNTLPSWFTYNLWGQVIYYSIGDSSLASPVGCAPQLSLDGVNVNGLFIMPHTPIGNIVRNVPTQSNNLADYFDDAQNQDGWGVLANDIYVSPISTSKDKVYVLP